jgi:hypothetical protein
MIGTRVRVLTNDGWPSSGAVEGVLHKLDAAGATVYRTDVMPESQGNLFIPMQRIREIVDLGRYAS